MGGARQCFLSVHSLKSFLIFTKITTSKTLTLEVDSADSIIIVKQKIKSMDNIILPVQQSLVFAGKQVENSLTLIDYSIRNESTLYLVFHSKNGLLIFKDQHHPCRGNS